MFYETTIFLSMCQQIIYVTVAESHCFVFLHNNLYIMSQDSDFCLPSTKCFGNQSIELFIAGTGHSACASAADDQIKLFLCHVYSMYVCVFYGCLSKCVSLLCVQSFFPIVSCCAWAQFHPPVQYLSFLTVGRLIFCFSRICLANKPLTRPKKGLGHCLDMKEQRGF